jgi:hypothetical protein
MIGNACGFGSEPETLNGTSTKANLQILKIQPLTVSYLPFESVTCTGGSVPIFLEIWIRV